MWKFVSLLVLNVPSDGTEFDFLNGTWTHVKDGMSLTTRFEPILDGSAIQSTTWMDDSNRIITTSILTFEPRASVWTKTQFLNSGNRVTFVGGQEQDGIALEQVSFNGQPFDPVQSRLLYQPVDQDGFDLDWQSSADGGLSWTPRPTVFEYERVDRPAAPGGAGRIAFLSNRDGNFEIYTMDPDGSDKVRITHDPSGDHLPRWIAGGARLAFLSQRDSEEGDWDRFEIDADGTDLERIFMKERLLAKDAGMFPEIHPSGSYLVYAAERDGEQDLYLSRYDGGGEQVLAPAPGLDSRPRWSPDGSRVLFLSERDGNPEIYTVGANGRDLRRLTSNEANDRYAHWSPDGSQIVFASDRDTPGALELYLMSAEGSDVRRLTDNSVEDGEPSWSPDGRFLAFRSDAPGNSEVCVLEIETGEITNLSDSPAYDAEPAWSP